MTPKLALLAVGDKGFHFAEDLLNAQAEGMFEVAEVFTYAQATSSYSTDDFRTLCSSFAVPLVVEKRPSLDSVEADIMFAVGWQYLINEPPDNLIVIHDSALPEFRGFAPTVAALMANKTELGVTAIRPSRSPDAGPIVAKETVVIDPPMRIKDAFAAIRPAYLKLAIKICESFRATRGFESTPQDESRASYSMWLDVFDYLLDWRQSADQLQRQIFAQSSPYEGSLAVTVQGHKYRVLDATVVSDVTFVNRSPGKTWAISNRGPIVVCGQGLLEVELRKSVATASVPPLGLRTRFADIAHARVILSSK